MRFAYFLLIVLSFSLYNLAKAESQPKCVIEQTDGVDFTCLRQWYSQASAFWPAPSIEENVTWTELAALPEQAPSPASNPFSEAKRALGEKLFFDLLLSRSKQVSCASCHEPRLAFADARRVSIGHAQQKGRRNAPSVATSSLFELLFWDGRKASLEEQALAPIVDPLEMAFSIQELEHRLQANSTYIRDFEQVFNDKPKAVYIGQALATYQRSLLPKDTAFERFMQGQNTALSDQALYGLHLFRTKGRCLNCHQGAALSDQQFHNLGLTYYGRKYEDLGRYEVTAKAEDVGAFRTPSLRLVSRTGPWMHNGLFPDLDGILNMYNAGMPTITPNAEQQKDPLFPKKSPLLQPLQLNSDELFALKAFLQSL